MFGLGWPELLTIAVVILLLFYSRKIPEIIRNLGKSVKEFKKEVKDNSKDENS